MSRRGFLREKLLDPVLRAQGTPESIARGAGLGIWIALTPTVGVQMILSGAMAVPLRANVPVALAMCWISNPITVVPLYFVFYWLGALLLGQAASGYRDMADRLAESFGAIAERGLLEGLGTLGYEVIWPMCVGSFVIATVVAVPSYHVLLWVLRRRRERRLLERVEQAGLDVVQGLDDRAGRQPRERASTTSSND